MIKRLALKGVEEEISLRNTAERVFSKLSKAKQTAMILKWGNSYEWYKKTVLEKEMKRMIKRLNKKIILMGAVQFPADDC